MDKKVEVIFIPDEDVPVVVDCCRNIKKIQDKNNQRALTTPKKTSWTPNKEGTPKSILTKSGRKVSIRFKSLNLSEKNKSESEESEELSDIELPEDLEKPTALFDDDDSVGKQLFGFKTPAKKNAMINRAKSQIETAKTPVVARTKIKKRIEEEAIRQKLEELFEDSESEYVPSSESSESSDSDGDVVEVKGNCTGSDTPTHRPRKEINHNFMYTSDEYFDRKNIKSVTSNHTLSKLKNPKIKQDQLTELIKSIHSHHEEALGDLKSCNTAMFKRWLFSMSEGYNVLVYGVGSKKSLLEQFRQEYLQDSQTMVVNGFYPAMNAKSIMDFIATKILKINNIPSSPHELFDAISDKMKSALNRVFIIIHNIDSGLLKCEKNQSLLSQLASLDKVHMLVSIDHINGPLIWDQKKLSDFNFIWEDATSFEPYLEETSYESSLMVQKSGSIVLSALKNVYQSLTRNTREIYQILLKHQLNNTEKQYQGMLFSELYRRCRDNFIVSSDLALRTQLTEFIDHQIVKWKKDTDHLIIPIDNSVLKQFQNDVLKQN